MDNQGQPPVNKPGNNANKGYGKRPVWQWVVIYLIVGAIVYGLVYYFFFMGNGAGTGGY